MKIRLKEKEKEAVAGAIARFESAALDHGYYVNEGSADREQVQVAEAFFEARFELLHLLGIPTRVFSAFRYPDKSSAIGTSSLT